MKASLWKRDAGGRGGSVVKGARVSVSVANGTMLVQIADVALVRLLFADRPATASVLTKTPETGETADEVPISYRE